MEGLGDTLRRTRETAGMSLTRVAAAAGVTKGYLSKLEAGTATPSIAVLSSLAATYGIAISELFRNGKESSNFALVRPGDRQPINRHGTELGYIFEAVSMRKRNPLAEAFFETIPPLGPDKPLTSYHHAGEEIFLVLEGRVRMFYGGAEYVLEPGDCAQFDPSVEHRVEAADPSVAKAFAVIMPPRQQLAERDVQSGRTVKRKLRMPRPNRRVHTR
jgi:transcriptional regulator with XRE-family HTH domain